MTVELPAGIQHGTPEGFAAGCRREKDCPALHTHGMCCLFAHVRSQTDPRYFKAKVRDPRPAAIAQRLGIRPPRPAVAAAEEQLDEEAAERSATQVYQPGRGWHKRPTDQQPVNNPEPRESAEPEPTDAPPIKHESTNPDPAQPLAEQSQDPDPQEDAGAPVIEDQTPAAATPDVEGEDMGHPTTTTTAETAMTTTTEQPVDAFAARCANAIATAAGRKKIRDWARAQGFVVPSRGKIPALYVRSFVQAQDGTATDADATPNPGNATSEPQSGTQPAVDETHEPAQWLEAYDDATAQPAPVEDLVVEVDLTPPDAFRPEWAGVAIAEDVNAARLTAARLEEENARLLAAATTPPPDEGGWVDPLIPVYQAQLTDLASQLSTAYTALELALRKLDEERQARVAEVAAYDNQIGKLITDRRRLVAANKIRGTIIEQAHATIINQARELRAAETAAARPFWRRRR